MNILYILPQLPDPPHSGGRIVTYNLIARLAKRHEVTVVSLIHDPEHEKDAERFRQLLPRTYTYPAHGKWDFPLMARSLFGGVPYKVRRFNNPEMQKKIDTLTASQSFDVIHCQNFYTAQYMRGDENAARILYTENFETLILERFAETKSNPLLRAAIRREAARTRRYELDCCNRFHKTLVISDIDRQRFQEARPGISLEVLPAGVDLDTYRPQPRSKPGKRIVFTGTMSYYPNADGVLWFAREVFPLIRKQVPDAVFQIVGDAPGEKIRALHSPGAIEVTGRVPDVRDYIAEASVYAVPLRIGGGVRLKILEAMAMGAAIVATFVGAEGLELTSGREIVLADEASTLADSIITLLRDDARRDALGANARSRAEADFGWDGIAAKLEGIYESVNQTSQVL